MPEIKFHKSDKFTFFTVDNYFTEEELDIIWPEIHSFDNQLSRGGDHRAGDVGTKGVFIHDKPLQYHQISLKWKFGNHPSVFLDQDITFRYMRNLHFSTCLLNYYEHNDKYDTHTDWAVYTMVVFLCKEPKEFYGGDFYLTDINHKEEYKNNKMIFFPSYAGHRVDEVQMFKTGDRNGRYSLTHFYYIPLDKNQMPISTQ